MSFPIDIGSARIHPQVENGDLRSIGAVEVDGVALRGANTRWLPWFDAFEGGVFNRFRFQDVVPTGNGFTLRTTAVCDNDYPFRERRDASGDLCFRALSWDAPPEETALNIHFEPAQTVIGERTFHGFKYWMEYCGATPIHRLVDRATWEVGGQLEGNNLVCRNWLTSPRVPLAPENEYSTVGLDRWAQLLPGNLWARWSLLPSFDMQYGPRGVLLAWFDHVSLIRSVIESGRGEDSLRVLDMHMFEQGKQVVTNPKTVLYCPDVLDDIDAVNLWTRVQDQEAARARRQFSIPDEDPPQLYLGYNVWKNMRFDSTYDRALDLAVEFGLDHIYIDSVFEHQQAFQETLDAALPQEQRDKILDKFFHQNMCVTLDFEVAEILGGEAGLKRLCDKAAQNGVGVLSWMSTHLSPNASIGKGAQNIRGSFGPFAAKESGRHPDTGYPQSCWALNLNTPVADKLSEQLIGVCQRTGLKGYLWDSFSNLSWWQLDYGGGTMRPQFDRAMELYGEMRGAGVHLMLEAIVTFSNHSSCGMHGGNVYEGDQLGYSYNSSLRLSYGQLSDANSPENRILKGEDPIDYLFQTLAHRRTSSLEFQHVPRSQWDPVATDQIKELFRVYKTVRHQMQHRTVLKHGAGVEWTDGSGVRLLWSFKDQNLAHLGGAATDIGTGQGASLASLKANRVYELREE